MPDSAKVVLCSHCAARLSISAEAPGKQFRCFQCGELTATQLGAALAENTAQRTGKSSGDIRHIKNLLRTIVLVLGLALMGAGTYTQLHGCSHDQAPKPVVVVPDR